LITAPLPPAKGNSIGELVAVGCSLEIFQGIFNPLFELLGVNAEILELRKGL
jgi:hypothetical protein